MASFEKQRKHPRVDTTISAQAKQVRKRESFSGTVKSLSEGGACLATSEKLLVGQEIILTFNLSAANQRKSCMVQAKIVWAKSGTAKGASSYGMAFQGCNEATLRNIHQFVETSTHGEAAVTGTVKAPRGQMRG